jgi:hypothetical protein
MTWIIWKSLRQNGLQCQGLYVGNWRQSTDYKLLELRLGIVELVIVGSCEKFWFLSYLSKNCSNSMHYIMILRISCKIRLYSDMFRWLSPPSPGKAHCISWNEELQKKKLCVMRPRLGPLGVIYQRRTWWAKAWSIGEDCRAFFAGLTLISVVIVTITSFSTVTWLS